MISAANIVNSYQSAGNRGIHSYTFMYVCILYLPRGKSHWEQNLFQGHACAKMSTKAWIMSHYVSLGSPYCSSFIFTKKWAMPVQFMILKRKQINNPGDSCRIVLSMNAGLQLILPRNVGTMLFSHPNKNQLWMLRETAKRLFSVYPQF